MADIQAFRGLRYDLGKVGSLSEVVAPPYDVIDSELQESLYKRNEHNVVRLILNRGDDLLEGQSVYERAAEHLKTWRREGALKPEHEGTIYVYHQTFSHEGKQYCRRGFMCRVLLEPFGEGSIYPHEETHSKVKEDRFKLMDACKCNLSQIFGIYPDTNNEAQEILEAAIEDRTPLTAFDDNEVKHEMWLVTNNDAIAAAAQLMGPKPIYIADGHHRYETACNIQKAARDGSELPPDHAVDYVLMMCVSMSDPGMAVLPTHRLFRGVDSISSADLKVKIGDYFELEMLGNKPALANDAWDLIGSGDANSLAFYCRADEAWVLAKINNKGMEKMAQIAAEQSADWRGLGVAILHKLVIDELLGYKELPSPSYVHSVEEVIEGLVNGDAAGRDATGQQGSGSPFELACLVNPASVEEVKSVSENGERMPAKSTYFYPKMLSGMVINPLD